MSRGEVGVEPVIALLEHDHVRKPAEIVTDVPRNLLDVRLLLDVRVDLVADLLRMTVRCAMLAEVPGKSELEEHVEPKAIVRNRESRRQEDVSIHHGEIDPPPRP